MKSSSSKRRATSSRSAAPAKGFTPDTERLERLCRETLSSLGEDPTREGLLRTPHRVAESLAFLTRGYHQDVLTILNDAVFEEECDEMVLVRDIEFYSMCEHHMIPFFGRCHVAYLPDRHIVGLSKVPRIVDMFSRRLQVQERLTAQIAGALECALKPRGVGVILHGYHLCMAMRGVEKQTSVTTTSAMLGAFKTDSKTRQEFLALCQGDGKSMVW